MKFINSTSTSKAATSKAAKTPLTTWLNSVAPAVIKCRLKNTRRRVKHKIDRVAGEIDKVTGVNHSAAFNKTIAAIKQLYKTFSLSELRYGLGVTGRQLFKQKTTIMYPEEKTPKSPRFRGLHALRRYPNGEERCIGCKLCEAVCPALAITIDSCEEKDGTRRTKQYEIDLFKCVYCGFCEEACPVDAIVMTDIHEFHMEENHQRNIDKQGLLAIGDKYELSIAAARKQDSPYR